MDNNEQHFGEEVGSPTLNLRRSLYVSFAVGFADARIKELKNEPKKLVCFIVASCLSISVQTIFGESHRFR